ncbi:MAG TPA: TIGR03560 family F420-dependent LLM class oxidoreductase [Ktedonobacterales bacterium]|nr:TIGR03560 family F420-dependent LLM class oxidoreductase [Ktedonobacterales bacterium]
MTGHDVACCAHLIVPHRGRRSNQRGRVDEMVALSLMIEGQNGLTWPRWKHLVADAEMLGFAGLFRSDHYTNAGPPDKASLEMVVSLAYAADPDHTRRIHFGPLVAPLSFREPAMLARQAAALDDLSGGRMILGLGAGWNEREHTLFGHELGDVAARMARFEEGLEVITRLLRNPEDEPVTYEGRFFHVRGATLLPQPQRPGGPPILIGGNGTRRTLPLVARYADVWNGMMLPPEQFRALSGRLDELLDRAGRPRDAVRRTLMTNLTLARDSADLERKLAPRRQQPALAGKSAHEIAEALWTERGSLAGTPEQVVARIRAFGEAGVEELMLQWLDLDDQDGLRLFAEAVMPQVAP